jgi:hypothetical protein
MRTQHSTVNTDDEYTITLQYARFPLAVETIDTVSTETRTRQDKMTGCGSSFTYNLFSKVISDDLINHLEIGMGVEDS